MTALLANTTRALRSPASVMLAVAVVAAACSSSAEPARPQQAVSATVVEPAAEEPRVTAVPVATPTVVPADDIDEPSDDGAPAGGLRLLAHRGVHQTFDREGVDDQTCTATRIHPPAHSYIENTLPSIEAAFAAGASVVEIDIAPTIDGVLAVFHDWEVDCRTDGTGEVRSLTWDEVSQLDIGYGYTADGETYPLRGQGVGLMPRLEEVFEAFPDGQFLINFKSDDPAEAELLQDLVEATGAADQVWAVYGAPGAVDAYVAATTARGFTEASIRACLGAYLAAGASNEPLAACDRTVVAVPVDLAPMLTGWPDAFVERMASHETHVIVSGPGLTGIDTQESFDALPDDVDLYVWTDRVEALS